MKKPDQKVRSLILCFAELGVGVLLLIKPTGFTSGIIIGCGAALMIKGLVNVVSYFCTPAQAAAQQRKLSRGLAELLAGGFCALEYQWLMTAVPFLGILYAVALLLLGVEKIQTAVDQRRLGYPMWYIVAVSAVASLVCAVLIFLNPFATTAAMWLFTGISLIVEAAVDIVCFFVRWRKA